MASLPSAWSITRALRVAAPLLSLAALASCGSNAPNFKPACPQTVILRDAADATRFRSAGTDLTDMVIDGRITGLSGKCSLDDDTHLRTSVSLNIDLTRGPAAATRTDQVAYFVSVSKGGVILDKQDFVLNVSFPDNNSRSRLTTDPVELVLPVTDSLAGAAYKIDVGFQLSPAQLAFNRRRGAR